MKLSKELEKELKTYFEVSVIAEVKLSFPCVKGNSLREVRQRVIQLTKEQYKPKMGYIIKVRPLRCITLKSSLADGLMTFEGLKEIFEKRKQIEGKLNEV